MDCTRLSSLDVSACAKRLVLDEFNSTLVLVMMVDAVAAKTFEVDMDDEDEGERAPALSVDDGGENWELESMSEFVHGTELGGFSGFDMTEVGCMGDMGWTLNGDRFSSL